MNDRLRRARTRSPGHLCLVAVAALVASHVVLVAVVHAPLATTGHHAHPVLTTLANTAALLGAGLMVGAGLLLLATRTVRVTGTASTWPGAVLLALAAYVAVNPAARLLDPGEPASLVGVVGRGAALALCAGVLVGRTRRPVRLLALAVPGLLATLVLLVQLQDRGGRPLDAPAGVHLLAETVLIVGWAALALVLAHRRLGTVGGWSPWSLAALVGLLHVLRAVDGGPAARGTLAAGLLLVAIAARSLATTWRDLTNAAEEVDNERWHLEDRLGEAMQVVDHDLERRHELAHDARNACAAVKTAVELLCDDGQPVDPSLVPVLRDLVARGVAELEHLVTDSESPQHAAATVDDPAAVATVRTPVRA